MISYIPIFGPEFGKFLIEAFPEIPVAIRRHDALDLGAPAVSAAETGGEITTGIRSAVADNEIGAHAATRGCSETS